MQKKKYLINFTEHNEKFCLSFDYTGVNSYLFVNGKEIHKFKAKDSEIAATPLCLGNISNNWTEDNMEKLDLATMFTILALIMMLLQLIIFLTFAII